jgi:hypothetical protein
MACMSRICPGLVSRLALVGLSMLWACSSSSGGQASIDGDGDAGDCPSATVSFQNDVMPVFAASCTASNTCHGQVNDGLAENLYLGASAEGDSGEDAGEVAIVYSELLSGKSAEDPSMNLVSAGALEESYLWHKVDGDQNTDSAVVSGCQTTVTGASACSDCVSSAPCGAQMPFASSLDPASVCVIRSWIAQGAKND